MTSFATADWLLQASLRATLLLAGLFAIWKLLPASRPSLRRRILLLAAAGLLAAPWLSGWWAPLGTAEASTIAITKSKPNLTLPAAAASLWIAGSLCAALRLASQATALRRVIRHAQPWRGRPLPARLTALQSSAITSPCVAQGRKPVLLLPDTAHHWSPSQWSMVLAHEQQHLHQQDLNLAWLPRLVHCLYWWHPLAHWLRRQFHAESEALCDRAVLAGSGHSAREYVEFLLSLNAARQPALTAGMAMQSPLGQRLERLLQHRPVPTRRWACPAAILLLAGLTLLSFSLRTLPPKPASAEVQTQKQAPTETDLRLTANPFPE
jgi:bla regulator protein blaR1